MIYPSQNVGLLCINNLIMTYKINTIIHTILVSTLLVPLDCMSYNLDAILSIPIKLLKTQESIFYYTTNRHFSQ